MPLFEIGTCDWCNTEIRDINDLQAVSIKVGNKKKKKALSCTHDYVCQECRDRLCHAIQYSFERSKSIFENGEEDKNG